MSAQKVDTFSAFVPDPDRALLLAVVVPGVGQLYNRQAWKLPAVLGIFLTLGYYIDYRHKLYSYVETAIRYETDQNPNTISPFPNLTLSTLRSNAARLRRDRDLLLVLAGVVYVLQAAEAHVAAHLLDFDNDRSLSLRSLPFFGHTRRGPVVGLAVRVGFLEKD